MASISIAPLRRHLGSVWLGVNVLLLVGIAATTVHLLALPNAETRRANESGQRAVIDPATGTVSLSSAEAERKEAFEVGSDTPAPHAAEAPTVDAMVPAAPAEATPAETAADPALPAGLPTLRTQALPTALPEAPAGGGLVVAPAPEVSETVDGLTLPKHGAGDINPATLYARPFARKPDQHLLSIVIVDAGLSAQSLPLIAMLPKEITIAFSPYGAEARSRIAALRRAGFELWGMWPMQNERYPQDDPGPLALVTSLPKDELMRRLQTVMAETIGSAGLVMPMDETASKKTDAFTPLLADVGARGLRILSTHPTRSAEQLTNDKTLQPMIRRADMILDATADGAAITAKLTSLPELLKEKDELVIVASARPQTLLLLQKWLKETPPAEPVTLAPLSALWLPKEAPEPVASEKTAEKKPEKKPEEKKPEKKPEAKKPEKKPEGEHH